MITFIQARVPRTSISKHYQQKAHFCDLSLCTDVPPPSEKNREKRFCFLREGGRRYTGYATYAFTKEHFMNLLSRGDGGGRRLQGNLWYSPPASMTSRLASVTFKMASKVFIEETDKNFDFITEILF